MRWNRAGAHSNSTLHRPTPTHESTALSRVFLLMRVGRWAVRHSVELESNLGSPLVSISQILSRGNIIEFIYSFPWNPLLYNMVANRPVESKRFIEERILWERK